MFCQNSLCHHPRKHEFHPIFIQKTTKTIKNSLPYVFKGAPRIFLTYFSTVFKRKFARKVQKGCECPEPKTCKDYEIVEEKKCIPCSFYNWKPKPKKCIEETIKEDMKPKKPRKCFAGMIIPRPASDCKAPQIDPFKGKKCLGPPPPPPKVFI